MRKHLLLFFLFLLLGLSKSWAIVGGSCGDPIVANLCGGGSFSDSSLNFNNSISGWTYNGKTIKINGPEIFYQVNLPVSSYQPVSLSALLAGYYKNCGCYYYKPTIYFLWFESSPCSSNPVAVSSYVLSGTTSFADSIFTSYTIQNPQSTYYLVIGFNDDINSEYSNYYYNLQLGFTNNQPSNIVCSPAPPPYKGQLSQDISGCYTSSNPYHLPLSVLHDTSSFPNHLYPQSLNQQQSYMPVDDDNGNGFALTIKTIDYINSIENYYTYDNGSYTYYPTGTINSEVAFTLFLKNIGVSGIKGFRLRVSGGEDDNQYRLRNTKGSYDTLGTWIQNFSEGTNSYTWLFESKKGRGDDTGNTGYNCSLYTFDGFYNFLGDSIQAWYLPDNYGNDTVECTDNSSRTDCGLQPTAYEQGWIPITLGGVKGGSSIITGSPCGNYTSLNPPVFVPCVPNYMDYDNSYGYGYESSITYDQYGCPSFTDTDYIWQAPSFTFSDSTLYNNFSVIKTAGICGGKSYALGLSRDSNYYFAPIPAVLVYYDGFDYYPVDSLGDILYSKDLSSLSIPSGFPPYPSRNLFTIPLSTAGTYTIVYYKEFNSQTVDAYGNISTSYTYGKAECQPGSLVLSVGNDPTIYFNPSGTDTVCIGFGDGIALSGNDTYYQWFPDSSANYDPYYGIATLTPVVTTTYTVVGTNGACSDTETYVVYVQNCTPKAGFTVNDTICSSSCLTIVNTSDTTYFSNTIWQWAFIGGTPSSYYGLNPPNICYNIPGNDTIQLIASNYFGSDTATKVITVHKCSSSCSNPAIANLCGSGPFNALTDTINSVQRTWKYPNGQAVGSTGGDVYYQVNVPVSPYQPVSLNASFKGYFSSAGGNNTVNFLWFEKSPCLTDTAALVSSFTIKGASNDPDSFLISYPVSNVFSQYYLVIDFGTVPSSNYTYSLQLDYTNNEPPPPFGCTLNSPPYKGTLQPDKSSCYNNANPYQLPLSLFGSTFGATNFLLPASLNQNLNYYPISDQNGNGFVLSLSDYVYPYDVYIAFDQFPYTYLPSTEYEVGITVFLKNAGGVEGLKGFKIQIPGAQMVSPAGLVPAQGATGSYNTSGTWTNSTDANTSTCTWLFNSANSRGDDADNSSYSCRVYNFIVDAPIMGDTVKAWFLPDDYGNDSMNCPRTDCSFGGSSAGAGWIPLSGNAIAGQGLSCEPNQTVTCEAGIYEASCKYFLPFANYCSPNIFSDSTPQTSFTDDGCPFTLVPQWDTDYPQYSAPILDGNDVYDTICQGSFFNLEMDYYLSRFNQTALLYQSNSSLGQYVPVDTLGNVFSNGFYSGSDVPVYPQNNFNMPLYLPGTYMFSSMICNPPIAGAGNLCVVGEDCGSAFLHLYVTKPVTINLPADTLICSGQSVAINATGVNSYNWSPNVAINYVSDSSVIVSPTVETTYTVSGASGGCISSATVDVKVQDCSRPADFSISSSNICKNDCITLTNTSLANTTSWIWNFPGGKPSSYTGKNPPNVCYDTAGNYLISLIAANSVATDTLAQTIVVNPCSPEASFTSPDTICKTTCITIVNSSSNATGWQWNFPGGVPGYFSGQTPPNVCYSQAGIYSIQLITSNNSGNDTLNKTVVVNDCSITASFSSPDTICNTQCIGLTGEGLNVNNWQWYFNGALPSTYNGQNPSNICFNTSTGAHTVMLIASNNYLKDTIYHTIYIKDCSPKAGLNGPDTICVGDCVTIKNLSSTNSTSWQWTFNGGSPAEYSGQTPPAICYQNNGQFAIQIIATNAYDSDTAYDSILVIKANAGQISSNTNYYCEGDAAKLSLANSSGSLQWQSSDTTFGFEDIPGATSNSYKIPSVGHSQYYRVISKNWKCADTSGIFRLIVADFFDVSYNWKDSSTNLVQFYGEGSSAGNVVYSWNFGDGDTSNEMNPVHRFSKNDTTYYVCLTVYERDFPKCQYEYCNDVSAGINAVANIPQQGKIEVYPDPFSDYLLINATGKPISEIELYDVLGRKLLDNEMGKGYPADNVVRLNVSGIVNGMYYLKVRTDNGDFIQSVVKLK